MDELNLRSLLIDKDHYVDLLSKFNEAGPYYTSYPAMGSWSNSFSHEQYVAELKQYFGGEGRGKPIHLYVHIPFCAKLCYYCICNMTVSNDRAQMQTFLNHLFKEIDMLARLFEDNDMPLNIKEIHLGGGTPSHLPNDLFAELIQKLGTICNIHELDEFAMEIDPRTTNGENLKWYASLGVRRISFGVQDFNSEVQQAINRVQPYEMVDKLLSPEVRAAFRGFNFDLLFGLPKQTRQTFRDTMSLVEKLSPERISLLKYAHVPNIRKHMNAIKDSDLPPKEHLPEMFIESVNTLLQQGYEWVGVDYFAKATDDLGKAVQSKAVWRTFNGFTPGRTRDILGIGPTSTGAFGATYSQNYFEFKEYYETIAQNRFPVFRGFTLNKEDQLRRRIIFSLLCQQRASLQQLCSAEGVEAQTLFKDAIEVLETKYKPLQVIEFDGDVIEFTQIGRLFIRNVCMAFDTFTSASSYTIPAPFFKGKRSLMTLQ